MSSIEVSLPLECLQKPVGLSTRFYNNFIAPLYKWLYKICEHIHIYTKYIQITRRRGRLALPGPESQLYIISKNRQRSLADLLPLFRLLSTVLSVLEKRPQKCLPGRPLTAKCTAPPKKSHLRGFPSNSCKSARKCYKLFLPGPLEQRFCSRLVTNSDNRRSLKRCRNFFGQTLLFCYSSKVGSWFVENLSLKTYLGVLKNKMKIHPFGTVFWKCFGRVFLDKNGLKMHLGPKWLQYQPGCHFDVQKAPKRTQ